MTFTEDEQKILESVPAGKKQDLLQFAKFLRYEVSHEIPEAETEKKPRRRGGWVKGEIWMAEDFNDPLEFVSSSEMRVLEAMRESKNLGVAV